MWRGPSCTTILSSRSSTRVNLLSVSCVKQSWDWRTERWAADGRQSTRLCLLTGEMNIITYWTAFKNFICNITRGLSLFSQVWNSGIISSVFHILWLTEISAVQMHCSIWPLLTSCNGNIELVVCFTVFCTYIPCRCQVCILLMFWVLFTISISHLIS